MKKKTDKIKNCIPKRPLNSTMKMKLWRKKNKTVSPPPNATKTLEINIKMWFKRTKSKTIPGNLGQNVSVTQVEIQIFLKTIEKKNENKINLAGFLVGCQSTRVLDGNIAAGQ